jgi:release factor glutamine methyltransferase
VTATKPARIVRQYAERLEQAGIEAPLVEAELILCHVLKANRLQLYLDALDQLDDSAVRQVESIVARRMNREPLQFILGCTEFFGREFAVTPAVMAPTPETERLCEAATEFVRTETLSAVTVACELAEAAVLAVDISPEALAVAEKNAARHQVGDRIEFRRSDLFERVGDNEAFDLILSNPPYIADSDYDDLSPEVKADPKIAMTAGPDGLDVIRRIVDSAPNYLVPRGRVMFEIGYDQAEAVAEMTDQDRRYQSLTILRDFNDIDRVVILGCGG